MHSKSPHSSLVCSVFAWSSDIRNKKIRILYHHDKLLTYYYHQVFFIIPANTSCFELIFFLSHTNIVTPNACLIVYFFSSTFNCIQLSSSYLMSITQWQRRVKACYLIQIEIYLLIIAYSSFAFSIVIDWCHWLSPLLYICFLLGLLSSVPTFLNLYIFSVICLS